MTERLEKYIDAVHSIDLVIVLILGLKKYSAVRHHNQ